MQRTIKPETPGTVRERERERELYFRKISVAGFIWNKIQIIGNKEKIRLEHAKEHVY